MTALTGGCFCRSIRYEIAGTPFFETICHCSICRRTTGSALVGWLTIQRSGFRLLSGEPKVFRSSDIATRAFCERCGTQLTFAFDEWPNVVDVTLGSLDDPNSSPPKDHTWTSAQLQWICLADQLPQYREAREIPKRSE